MSRPPTRSTGAKAPLAPDTADLDGRSARAWTEAMVVRPIEDGQYAVEGESGVTHVVDPGSGWCSCPDHAIRGHRCKHLRRVALEITRGLVPPPTEGTAPCSVCGAPAPAGPFAPVCGTCQVRPGDIARDRETGDRVFVVAVTEERADEVTIGDTGVSVAAYPTNGRYDPASRVVEAVYAEAAARDGAPKRYAFPAPRLTPLHRTDDGGDRVDRAGGQVPVV